MNLNPSQQRELLALARESIHQGISLGTRAPCPEHAAAGIPPVQRSTFVTLRIGSALRGCCGTLDAPRLLAHDTWTNAWTSAFADPRFAPLTAAEHPQIHLHISVLSELEPMPVASEAALLQALRPHVDGLLLQMDATRATFLPAVWEQIAEPERFLHELKFKAGWRADFWSPRIRVWRYGTQSFGESG